MSGKELRGDSAQICATDLRATDTARLPVPAPGPRRGPGRRVHFPRGFRRFPRGPQQFRHAPFAIARLGCAPRCPGRTSVIQPQLTHPNLLVVVFLHPQVSAGRAPRTHLQYEVRRLALFRHHVPVAGLVSRRVHAGADTPTGCARHVVVMLNLDKPGGRGQTATLIPASAEP